MNYLERAVTLMCPLCGGNQFESMDETVKDLSEAAEDVRVYCLGCKTEYTIRELIDKNAPSIDKAVEELAYDFVAEVERRRNGQQDE